MLGEEERKDALGVFPGPSPPEDLIVHTREVNIMQVSQSSTRCTGKPGVWVTGPLGSRRRRTED